MTDLDDSLHKLTSGFTTSRRQSGGREKVIGSKKMPVFQADQRLLVVVLRAAPTAKDLDWFFKEAERFVEDYDDHDIQGVYLLSPVDVDRDQFKSLLNRTEPKVARSIKPVKTYRLEQSQESGAGPPALAIETPIGQSRPELSDSRIVGKSPHERVLYEWDIVYSESGQPPVPAIVAVTQERCVLFRRVGSQLLALGVEIKWDQVTNIESNTLDKSPVVDVNDGKKIHHLHHSDAPYIARLIRHLQWTRQGYLTGFAEIYQWNGGLRDAITQDMLGGRYASALANGFRYVEAEIRRACNLPGGTPTKTAIATAFNPTNGQLAFGRTEGERSGLLDFVNGAFALYRNPAAHDLDDWSLGLNGAIQSLNVANTILALIAQGQAEARSRPLIKPRDPPREPVGGGIDTGT